MHRRAFLLAAAALAVSAKEVLAQPAGISVMGAWVRPTARGQNAAGYLMVMNAGRSADTLLRVECAGAARSTLHESRMTGGVMSMRPLNEVAIPAGGHVTFAPGGLHIMLEGLRQTLAEGQSLAATLVFRNAGRVRVTFRVRSPAAAPMDMGSMPGMSH